MEVIEQARYAGKDELRVFFAIWPDSAAREQLLEIASGLQRDLGCTGRRIRAENIHLTLVFVGNVDNRGLQALCDAAEGIAKKSTAPFELVIQKIGYWKHNCVAYAAPLGIPSRLEELVSFLRKATESIGFSPEERAYKRPHRNAQANPSHREYSPPPITRSRPSTNWCTSKPCPILILPIFYFLLLVPLMLQTIFVGE